MERPPTGPPTTDQRRTSCAVVVVAAKLLRSSWGQLSDRDRDQVLDRLTHHAQVLGEGLEASVQAGGGALGQRGDRDRIEELEIAARVSRERIEALESLALDSEAAALVSDARILELAEEVERLLVAQEQAAVIDDAKGVLMHLMRISEDAAFAVLVAAAQKESVTLHTIARRLTASRDESTST